MTETWIQLKNQDYPRLAPMLRAAVSEEAYLTLPADAPDEDCAAYWFGSLPGSEVWALEEDGQLLGSFYQRPNHYALGGHVANGGYVVAPEARGRGIGRRLGEKSLERARQNGYKAIQFNFVVSTNEVAVALWKSLGFKVIGTIPGGYHYKHQAYVDAYIMYREL